MYPFKKLLMLAVVMASLLSVTHAHANETKKYFGFGIGNASWDLEPLGNSLENGTAIRGFIGLRTGNKGFEAELDASFHDWEGWSQSTHYATHLILSGVGYIPVSPAVDLYGKIGLNQWTTTVDLWGTSDEGESGFNLALAGGVNFGLSEKVHLRTEYQFLPGLDDGLDKGDISQFTVNAVINF